MLVKRVIACLDVDGGRVKKGVRFENLRDIGDPVALAERYEQEGIDEIVYLDISASAEGRSTLLDVVRGTAESVFIPLTVGGGINSVDDVAGALRAGADKVSLNTAIVKRPGVISEAAERFGSQCVVASIDAAREGSGWRVWIRGGREATELDAVEWAAECARLGAGEILLTSIDRDGTRDGYDVDLVSAVASNVTVPVIASGGAGSARDVKDVLVRSSADAALVAGILHDGVTSVADIKGELAIAGVRVRSAG
jgi:imidazole glycerol-phosphate synthase subunit HisF